jgi:PTS system N-acetylglucosamine-specific IIC component
MLGMLQRVGRALMMPIAVLPAAALMLGLGVYFQTVSWLIWGDFVWRVMEAGGNAVLGNLPLIFAIGVAIGFSEGAGAAGLAGGVGYVVLDAINGLTEVTPAVIENGETVTEATTIDMGVLGGIIIGLLAAWLYRRYHDIDLPEYLAFFGGRRFVPIATAFAAIVVGLIAAVVWPPIGRGIDGFGNWLVAAGGLGAFIYGVANRALLPFGLHHIINTLVWFQFGTFEGEGGEIVRGDLNRYFAGDPEAGLFMAGWYIIMMFGLPAAAYAMYRAADDDQKKSTSAIMGATGFTSFLTGITEPIEYSFMFLAPVLYGVHAVLSGTALVVADALGIKHGFGFSAGLIDYVVNFGLATNPLLLIPVGLVFALIYFVLFSVAIRTFDLATPGRPSRAEREAASVEPSAA